MKSVWLSSVNRSDINVRIAMQPA